MINTQATAGTDTGTHYITLQSKDVPHWNRQYNPCKLDEQHIRIGEDDQATSITLPSVEPDLYSTVRIQPTIDSKPSFKTTQDHLQKFIDTLQENCPEDFEVYGDNLDVTVNPSYMTAARQRKSLHYFLLLMAKKRVKNSYLADDGPQRKLVDVSADEFLPTNEDCEKFRDHAVHHMMNIIAEYIPHFNNFRKILPRFIQHPFMEEVSQKSDYVVLDLIDKNENKPDEMIDILDWLHDLCVSKTHEPSPTVIEDVVFGGDVLTEDRAYQAQQAMANGDSDFERLAGVHLRPEGLHRIMNMLGVLGAGVTESLSRGAKMIYITACTNQMKFINCYVTLCY